MLQMIKLMFMQDMHQLPTMFVGSIAIPSWNKNVPSKRKIKHFFPIYFTWIAHNTKNLHSIKLKSSSIKNLNCHEINKTLNKFQWQLNWPFLWFFNQAYCFDYLWSPGLKSPQHGSASSAASIFNNQLHSECIFKRILDLTHKIPL